MQETPAAASSLSHEKLLEIARSLPADLRVLSKLGTMLQDPNCNLIGFGEVMKLVGPATAGRMSEASLPRYDINAKLLCDNLLCAPFAVEALARPVGIDSRRACRAPSA